MSQMGMDPSMMKQESGYHDSTGQWVDNSHAYNQPHHQSPVHEYNNFAFNPMPMEPMYTAPMHPPPRTTHQQLQPLIMPQWPSMITTQSTYVPPVFPTAPVPIPPASTPVSATSTRSSSTPRKTLTDADRRRMCLYAEEHPTVKQTEIGAMFGVERSTVSKVLRQKEKYLYQEDGSRSPIKRSKGKFPDIERALSNWARNHQKQGLPLSDAMIRDKARFFATTVGSSESALKLTNGSWLEKFKQKNNLLGSKSRKNSLAEDSEGGSNPPSMSQTPNGISPTSPSGVASPSPIAVTSAISEDGLKIENADDMDFNNNHRPFHSQSNTSLSSVYTNSSFSAGPTSPTSPFNFTPDSACGPSPFMPSQQNRIPPGSSNFQRPRSQTFPMLGIEPYLGSSGTSEALTPKYLNSTALDSPISEIPPHIAPEDTIQSSDSQSPHLSRSPSTSMHPPPVPSTTGGPTVTIPIGGQSHGQQQPTPISPGSSNPVSPSQEDARRALEVVMNFFQHQPNGFVEPQDFITIGKLMEKLKLQRNGEHLPGGLHRIPEQEYMVAKTEAV